MFTFNRQSWMIVYCLPGSRVSLRAALKFSQKVAGFELAAFTALQQSLATLQKLQSRWLTVITGSRATSTEGSSGSDSSTFIGEHRFHGWLAQDRADVLT